ncbi:MAG: PAS domain S-box protein [Halochromatium sp.]|uniref:PAS domain S-box protein n=1 Tax=Halochromatium sp. TaxID=2049430 RepID=UPI003979F1D9
MVAAAAAGSSVGLPLLYGLHFPFALVAVLLALVWLGLPAGLAVAAAQAGVMAPLHQQSPALLLLGAEVVFVSVLLARARRREQERPFLPLLVGLYWLVLGAPLTLLDDLLRIDVAVVPTLLLVLKQAVNDIVTALLAECVLLAVALVQRRHPSLSIRRLLLVLFSVAALFPACVLTFLGTHDVHQRLERELFAQLRLFATLAAEMLPADAANPRSRTASEQRLQTLLAEHLPSTAEPTLRLLPSANGNASGEESPAPVSRQQRRLSIAQDHGQPRDPFDWSQVRYRLRLPLPEATNVAALEIELSAQVLIEQIHLWLQRWLLLLLAWAALVILVAHWLSRRLAAPLQAVLARADALPASIDSGQPMPAPPLSPLKEEVAAARAMNGLGERLQASFKALAEERDQQREQRALRALQAETLAELIGAEADERQVAEHLCQAIARQLPGHHCNLVVATPTDSLEVLAAPGMRTEEIALLNARLANQEGALAYQLAFETAEFSARTNLANTADDQPRLNYVGDNPPGACWCQPICGQYGQVLGVLAIAAPEPGRPNRFARALLEHGASLAAVALGNLKLRRDHRVLLDALSQAETGIVIAERLGNGDHAIRFVNKGFENLTGYRGDEVFGRDCRFLQGTDRDQPARRALRTALAAGEACQATLRNYRKDGSLFWNSVSITPVVDAQGRISHYIGIQRNDTDRIHALERLRASEAQLREITETIEEVFWVLDIDSNQLTYVSRAFEAIWEQPVAALRADPALWYAHIHADDRERVMREHAEVGADDHLKTCEYRLQIPAGRRKWIAERRFLVRDPEGRACRVIGVATEITDRKQAELDLIAREQLERELVALTTTFIVPSEIPFDRLLQDALAKVGDLAGADRAYIFQFDRDGETCSNTHEWVAADVEPMIATLQDCPVADFSVLLEALEEADLIVIPRVADLPKEWATLRQEFQRQGIQSLILVPLRRERQLSGFIGLDAVHRERGWLKGEVHFLRVLANVFLGALERKRVLAELWASTERYDALALQSRMMTWEIDPAGVYTYVNPVAEALLGYSPADLIGRKTFYELIPAAQRAEVKARAFTLIARHQPWRDFQAPVLTAAGRRLWLSVDGIPLFAADGSLRGYRGSALDITDVQQAETQRRDAEQALQRYAEDLERLVDLSNRGLDANAEIAALLGIAKDALGMSVAETGWRAPETPYQCLARLPAVGDQTSDGTADESAAQRAQAATEALFATPASALDQPRLIYGAALPTALTAQGYQCAVVTASRFPGDAAQQRWLLTQFWDARARATLASGERELLRFIAQRIAAIEHGAQLARDLVNAKQRETIGHLASGVAHDFNNVLAVLDANLYYLSVLVEEANLDDDSQQVIDDMNSVLGQAKVITSGMLALSRAGGVPLRTTLLDKPLTELADILRLMLPETLDWDLRVEPDLGAKTNAGFLQAALLNLALNARDAMTEGGTLSLIGCREHWSGEPPLMVGELTAGDYAAIRISDTGCGMTDAVLARIFEPLFSTKTQRVGHGLGMFMVREFVLRSGAGLSVSSTIGVGTTFTLLLPLAERDAEDLA